VQNDADRAVADILLADDEFLALVGKLALLFSCIEDSLVHDFRELNRIIDNEPRMSPASQLEQLRILEKRDCLKRVVADIGHFYDVDCTEVRRLLDELGNLNRLRRSVVHGWIRWSKDEEKPIFIDSHGNSLPAWHQDIAELNIRVLNWQTAYYEAQATLGSQVLRAYNGFADRLLQRPNLPLEIVNLVRRLKTADDDDALD